MFELSADTIDQSHRHTEDGTKQYRTYTAVATSDPANEYPAGADDDATSVRSPSHVRSNKPAADMEYCSYCERRVLPNVEHQPSALSFIISILLILTCGWIACCVIPFCWPLTQTVVHQCPLCGTVLKRKGRISCFGTKDQVITLRIGSCAVVLSRRYFIAIGTMLLLLGTFLSVRWYLSVFGLPDLAKGETVEFSWNDFLNDCGMRGLLGNPVKAERVFHDKYYDKTVVWEGRLHHVQEGIFSKHFAYVDMTPRQNFRPDARDLALIFGKHLLDKVASVDPGDRIFFEATLLELGRRGRPLLGVLWDFNVTDRAADLPPLEENLGPLFGLRHRLGQPPIDFHGLMLKAVRESRKDDHFTNAIRLVHTGGMGHRFSSDNEFHGQNEGDMKNSERVEDRKRGHNGDSTQGR